MSKAHQPSRLRQIVKSYSEPSLWIKNLGWRISNPNSKKAVIFVVGSPRSGTTLVQRILTVHSEIASIEGETGFFTWRNLFDPKRNFFNIHAEKIATMTQESSSLIEFFDRCYDQYMLPRTESYLLEKTPQHVNHLAFILKHFRNARVINVIRDGRDCFCSAKDNPWIPQNKSAATFARYWKKCINNAQRFNSDPRVLNLRYEELANQTDMQLKNVMAFLGLELEADQTDPSRFGSDRRANLKEFEKLSQPINNSSVNRWRTQLSQVEIQCFEKVAGKELIASGYELSSQ